MIKSVNFVAEFCRSCGNYSSLNICCLEMVEKECHSSLMLRQGNWYTEFLVHGSCLLVNVEAYWKHNSVTNIHFNINVSEWCSQISVM